MKFSKLPLFTFIVALVIVAIWGSFALALNLGIRTEKIQSEGIYLGASFARDYNQPLSGFQLNNVYFDAGWTWNVYGVQVDLIPAKINLGSENNFKFGVQVRKYIK